MRWRTGLLLWAWGAEAALEVDLDSPESIKKAAALKAYDAMTYYKGNLSGQIPGILPGPPPGANTYYWWMGGALWGTLLDYWHYTGDTSYNEVITQSLIHQATPQMTFMHDNWTASLGNDDQGFWGLSAMLAAENNFPDPPEGQPQWLAMAQGVFNTQAAPDRHDNVCGGGLRWQIYHYNTGYDYKNAIANGCFFNLGVRLARYTNNQTYADWAIKTWDWMENIGLIDKDYNVWDGAHDKSNCTDISGAQFTYNAAIWLQGAAFMYNWTNGDSVWEKRVDGLTDQMLKVFFAEGIAKEINCESLEKLSCSPDMLWFKGFAHRWLAVTAQIAPFTAERIRKVLRSSAKAAAAQCSDHDGGRECGYRWVQGTGYDGTRGAAQETSVLAALLSVLAGEVQTGKEPVTADKGGTSKGDVNAGKDSLTLEPKVVTTADKAGAGILTAVILVGATVTFVWMSSTWQEHGIVAPVRNV